MISVLHPPGTPLDANALATGTWSAFNNLKLATPIAVVICEKDNPLPLFIAPSAKAPAGHCDQLYSSFNFKKFVIPLENTTPQADIMVFVYHSSFIVVGILFGLLGAGIGLVFLMYWEKKLVQEKNLAVHTSLIQLATQVAHDIRSPLAALDLAVTQVQNLDEQPRLIIRSAASRIRDIANDLLNRSRQEDRDQNTLIIKKEEPLTTQLLSALIESLITEKRMQFRSRLNIELELFLDASSYGLFADVQPQELKRVLSNLINNSVEAMSEHVIVQLQSTNFEILEIVIKDNGKGIPAEILPKLTQRGASFGKKEGSGLGLYHCKQSIEKWNGRLNIQSTHGGFAAGAYTAGTRAGDASGNVRSVGNKLVGAFPGWEGDKLAGACTAGDKVESKSNTIQNTGTTVTLTLPKAPAPFWFVPELQITSGMSIVILDDDMSIHHIWEKRFFHNKDIKLFHFSTAKELRECNVQNEEALYLIDYELIGQAVTGLDLIEDLEIEKHSVLVTSHFEEEKIQTRCKELSVKLVPKGLAGFVPIVNSKKLKFDAVLIDDSNLIHLTWISSAQEKEKSLKTFFAPNEFDRLASSIDKATPIYVDANLGNKIKGEAVTRKLSDQGFKNVYLATGYDPEHFTEPMPWLKGLVGKQPPWN